MTSPGPGAAAVHKLAPIRCTLSPSIHQPFGIFSSQTVYHSLILRERGEKYWKWEMIVLLTSIDSLACHCKQQSSSSFLIVRHMRCWFNPNFPHPDGGCPTTLGWSAQGERCSWSCIACHIQTARHGSWSELRGKIKKVTEDCRGDIRPLSRHVKEWETGREKGDMWLQAA